VESGYHSESYQLLDWVLNSEAPPPDLCKAVYRQGRELQALLRSLVSEGQGTGEVVAGDPDQLVRTMVVRFDGLTRWATHDP
jgi:hypothetical protein